MWEHYCLCGNKYSIYYFCGNILFYVGTLFVKIWKVISSGLVLHVISGIEYVIVAFFSAGNIIVISDVICIFVVTFFILWVHFTYFMNIFLCWECVGTFIILWLHLLWTHFNLWTFDIENYRVFCMNIWLLWVQDLRVHFITFQYLW